MIESEMDIEKELQSAFEHYQSGNYDLAEEILKRVLDVVPDSAEIHNNLGLVFQMDGKLEQAIEHFQRALELDPESADANYNMGNALKDKKHFEDAIQFYQKALKYNPYLAEAHNNIGIALHEKGRFDEAVLNFQNALELKVDYAEAYFNMGNAFHKKKQHDYAMASYNKALKINPALYEAYNNIGLILQEQGNLMEAISNYRKVVQIKPDFAMAYFNLGTVFQKEKKLDEAITNFKRALQLDPDIDNAHLNLGIALHEKGFPDEALSSYEQAVKQKPDSIDALTNLGIVLQAKQRLVEAISVFRKVLQMKPDDAEAHWNFSITLLLSGNFEAGWMEYEWRQHVKEFEKRSFTKPRWNGEDIRARAVLLYAEQGIGDTIQFVRYAPLLAQKGARVFVECQAELVSLLTGVDGVQEVIKRGEVLPEFDMHCSLLSLPYIFNTSLETIPSRIPYIQANPSLVAKWGDKVRSDTHLFKVGIAWSGNPKYKHDHLRSCELETFACLANIEGIDYFSLQKRKVAEQATDPLAGLRLIDFMDEVNDFADTAAIIQNLDLVISVDTAVAHLAGALGKTVWILLPYTPDWRWMLDREDSPWYPTMSLFRQKSPGEWGPVIEKVAEELRRQVLL
jgi:tetratricopeptide (TPR) repeat protein